MRALPLLLALVAAPLAGAQSLDVGAAPASGTLSPGASETLRLEVALRAAGEVPGALGAECVGYVDASAPDAVVQWGGGDLEVRVEGDLDPTLVVARPDGTWACNDDADGVLPLVAVPRAPAGRYAVWVGSFSASPTAPRATLVAGAVPPPPVLEADAAPRAGALEARGGFEADGLALDLEVEAGGTDRVGRIEAVATVDDVFCVGYVEAGPPTAAVAYTADGGTGRLAIGATSRDGDDLVLLVLGPDGRVHCNDDYLGADPLVVVEGPASGRYAVWAGTYASTAAPVAATLTVAESADDMGDMDFDDMGFDDDFSFAPFSSGTYAVLDLEAVPAVRLAGGADGAVEVDAAVAPSLANPVSGSNCAGYLEPRATVAMELAGPGPFALRASGEDDLTMTVLTPGGLWFCSDDAEGLDPGIQLDGAEDGVYRVWVGTFSDVGASSDVTVSVGPGEVVAASAFGEGADRVLQTDGVYDGSEIRPGAAAAEVSLNGDIFGTTESVMAGGRVLNPVRGGACQGFVSERPTLSVFSGLPALRIEAASDTGEDLTMVVRGPAGAWVCSDDAVGSAPAVEVRDGAGEYSVWVGTFSRRAAQSPATVEVSVPPPPPPAPTPEVIRG